MCVPHIVTAWRNKKIARNAVHVDHAVKEQTLPEALEYVWQGYRAENPQK